VNYHITENSGWIIVNACGKAHDNEPRRITHLFNCWLSIEGIRVIIDLKQIARFGIRELGLLASFKSEVDQRHGTLRLCSLNRKLHGSLACDREAANFALYPDLKAAMAAGKDAQLTQSFLA
jgi:hypothetical protein